MAEHPSGTVTFLFTDIEGSTKLAQEYPDRWESLRARHHAILQSAMDAHNGYVFQIIGDAFCVAFHTASDGLSAAITAQRKLQTEDWGDTPVKVRIGINTGTAQASDMDNHSGGYKGYTAMARVQRVMSVGYGGQILLSNSSYELVRGELPNNISLRDMGEHRLKSLLNPEHLWQVNVPYLLQDFSPLQSLNKIPNNLPVQLTSFIGREKEIAEIKQGLTEHRLVTLTGSGGTGKSRLSLQVAADVIDHYPDGVWFVEFAPLADPDLIPQTILAVLRLGEQPGKTALKVLEESLNTKKLILILDNCEHLIEPSARVVNALLLSAPEIKILASSREALGVKGELAWHVPSLGLPDPKAHIEIEQLTQYESVRLFIERASLVQPHFKVDKDNAPAIAQICYRLDGIPLAMELAAARLKLLSADQIAARLDDRFRLLTGGARTAMPRQQTLRATVDWSYDLLAENEKLLLRRLAVFAGGWSLELAEQICSDDKLDALDILDMLGHLVDKSLVTVEENKTGTRYRILETVRQYAREKLFETDEITVIRTKHRDVYLAFVEKIEPEIVRAQRLKWANVLKLERDNLRTAFNWSLENKDGEEALRFCSGLANFWGMHRHEEEGLLFSKQALALTNEKNNLNTTFWYAATLHSYVAVRSTIELKSLSDPTLMPLLEQAHHIFESINNYTTSAPVVTYSWLAEAHMNLNDLTTAERYLSDLDKKVNASGYQLGIAWTRQAMAGLALTKGDTDSWIRLLEEALELYRALGDEWFAKNILQQLIWQKYLCGEINAAVKLTQQNILLHEKDGELHRVALCHQRLGVFAFCQGEYETAHQYFLDAVEIYAEVALRGDEALAREEIAFLLLKEDKIEEAKAQYQALFTELKDSYESDSLLPGIVETRYALLCLYEKRLNDAMRSLEIGLGALQKHSLIQEIYLAYFGFGELARLKNNYSEALKNYHTSLQYANNLRAHIYYPKIVDGIAKTKCLQLSFDKAAGLFGSSDALRKKFGIVIHPVDRPDYDKHIELLKSQMSAEQFESAWAEGAKMSIEEMSAFAMQEDEQ